MPVLLPVFDAILPILTVSKVILLPGNVIKWVQFKDVCNSQRTSEISDRTSLEAVPCAMDNSLRRTRKILLKRVTTPEFSLEDMMGVGDIVWEQRRWGDFSWPPARSRRGRQERWPMRIRVQKEIRRSWAVLQHGKHVYGITLILLLLF